MSDNVGGQAVIEGIMMRSSNKIATAVRLKNGKIKVKKEKMLKRHGIWKKPFFRGAITLWDTLYFGVKSLIWSANEQLEKHEKITKKEIVYTLLISFGFAILIFIALPFFLTQLTTTEGFLFNLIDGVIRVVIFFIYLWLISLMSDVKLLFKYHGAEHKAVHCYEAKKKLTYENIKKYSTLHARCGTAFIFIVLFISIVVFSLVISNHWYIKLGSRIVLIPVIASISYEILKLSDKFKGNLFFRALGKPGLWMQKITTKEPTKKQIEVAVKALNSVL